MQSISSNVKRAVVPMGGLGTRLLPATTVIPKELFPILNKPLIHIIVEEIIDAGIDSIIFVLSKKKDNIYHYFNDIKQKIETEVAYQEEPLGLGQTTKLTSQYVAYKNKEAMLNVCEHNYDWIDTYKPQLTASKNFKINHFDLEYFEYDGQKNDKYTNLTSLTNGQKFDLIIVDGPVGGGKNFPRSNILDLIPNNLEKDFIIIVDDSERDGEKRLIEHITKSLTSNGVDFKVTSKRGIKMQTIITSVSLSFVEFL